MLDVRAMPDDEDHQVFGHLLRHPEEWSTQTRAQMEQQLRQQRQLVTDAHPRDRDGRARLQGVVVAIEAAIDAYDDVASR